MIILGQRSLGFPDPGSPGFVQDRSQAPLGHHEEARLVRRQLQKHPRHHSARLTIDWLANLGLVN